MRTLWPAFPAFPTFCPSCYLWLQLCGMVQWCAMREGGWKISLSSSLWLLWWSQVALCILRYTLALFPIILRRRLGQDHEATSSSFVPLSLRVSSRLHVWSVVSGGEYPVFFAIAVATALLLLLLLLRLSLLPQLISIVVMVVVTAFHTLSLHYRCIWRSSGDPDYPSISLLISFVAS